MHVLDKFAYSLVLFQMNGEISDSIAGCCNRVEAAAGEEQQISRRRSSRRLSTCASKSMYRTRSNASKGMPNFEASLPLFTAKAFAVQPFWWSALWFYITVT